MNKTTIEWTDYTWNPVTGCTKVSQGCKNCYAETLFTRFEKKFGHAFTEINIHPDRLLEPAYKEKRLRGKKVFVCDVSDLFHERVPDDFIYDVFETIYNCPDTIFQILTKRLVKAERIIRNLSEARLVPWPLPNVWIGTSCEDQATANERIPLLLQIPAAVRFLSCEPLLGPIDFTKVPGFNKCGSAGVDLVKNLWVIAGGESGHGARPMHPDWVRSLRDQCQSANVPFFFKQWGEWAPGSEHGPNIMCLNPDKKHFLFDEKAVNGCLDPSTFQSMYRAGKSKSGNILDGKQHLEFPKA